MITGYAYTAMLVTGILHGILGFCCFVTSISGMSGFLRVYCGVALAMSIWILLVGCLGITAGLKHLADDLIRKFKIAYMVTAILSACIFSLTGLIMFCCTFTLAKAYREWEHYITIGHVGSVFMSLEFVLAIVSSSICCCCSASNPTTTVIIQTPVGVSMSNA